MELLITFLSPFSWDPDDHKQTHLHKPHSRPACPSLYYYQLLFTLSTSSCSRGAKICHRHHLSAILFTSYSIFQPPLSWGFKSVSSHGVSKAAFPFTNFFTEYLSQIKEYAYPFLIFKIILSFISLFVFSPAMLRILLRSTFRV